MAVNVVDENTIALNSKYYKIDGRIRPQLISKFPSPIRIGDSSYNNESLLSSWIMKRWRGGLGYEEIEEGVNDDCFWWSTCITDIEGHLVLPRLATSITPPTYGAKITDPGLETWTDANTLTNWTFTAGTTMVLNRSTTVHSGTYSANIDNNSSATTATIYQDVATWNNNYRGQEVSVYVYGYVTDAANTHFHVSINDGVATTESSAYTDTSYTKRGVTRTLNAAATRIRIILTFTSIDTGASKYCYFDGLSTDIPYLATIKKFVNFNSNQYLIADNTVLKLNAGRTAYTLVDSVETAEATAPDAEITDVIVSLNSRLYVFCGDSVNYYYLATDESLTQSNSANAYWGFQWDSKLFKMNSSGTMAYSTDPDGGAPTWTADATITDIASQIESFFIGKDADGDDVPYCATNSTLKVLDFANTIWLDTALRLPNHPNGGKGATYWRDAHYISSGLDVRKYVTGSTASISEAGLNRNQGIPSEYNGEIVKLYGDGASDDLFALVDASQVTGTAKSGLYAYDGRAWRCWWIDTSDDGAMHDVIVSSASSAYAVYWDVGGLIYYIDIPRGIRNPKKLTTQNYATSGIHITGWFDAGTAVFNKVITKLVTFAKSITTTETIALKYRTDHTNTDIDTGWDTLDTLNTTGENNENEELLASGAGSSVNAVQLRFDLARGSTATNTPDLQAAVLNFIRDTGQKNWAWSFTIICDTDKGQMPKEIETNLKTAAESTTLVPFIFRSDDTNETHYVMVDSFYGESETGENFRGRYNVTCVEP